MRRRHTLSIAMSIAALVAGLGAGAPAATAAPPSPHVVQLGDSYSAGNGAGSYIETTCWRSTANYGTRVAEEMGATYDDVACSGSVVADILNPRELGPPTVRTATYELPGRAPNVEHHWMRQAKQDQLCGIPGQDDWFYDYRVTTSTIIGTGIHRRLTATVQCQLTADPQVDAVTKDTDAVFLTVGGNDIGFTDIALQCMIVRSAPGCEKAINTATHALPTLQQDITEALAAVHERANGRADVYLLGYPFLLDTDSYGIPEGAPTYDAGAALDQLQVAGDQVQRAAMAELDVAARGPGDFTFVDVKPAWDGHTHGLDPHVVPDNSNAWLVPILAPGRQFPEWVHPTTRGYEASATALLAAID